MTRRYLIARRVSQIGFLALFLSGPMLGIWVTKGTLAASRTLDILPLTDPFLLAQSLAAGHALTATALLGAGIVVLGYLLLGGRAYCAWVCPINPVTDAAFWLHSRLGLPKGWQPPRNTRVWLAGAVLLLSALTGTLFWEAFNPITALHRALIFSTGGAWALVLAVFLLDLVARRAWCGHLCPVGAAYGLLGRASVLRVSARNRAACDDCMDCFAKCPEPQVITPALRGQSTDTPLILARDCTNCGACIEVCDQEVFTFTHRFDARIATARPPIRHPRRPNDET